MMWQVLVVTILFFTGSLGSNFESCPPGWYTLSTSLTTTCVFWGEIGSMTYDHAYSQEDALSKCVQKNSSLVIIDTQEKLDELKGYGTESVWIGLHKNGSELYWLTKDGPILAENIPFDVNWQVYSDRAEFLFQNGKLLERSYYYGSFWARYACEQQPACKKGWIGLGCDRECHCHDEECDQEPEDFKCSFGCEVGWMGDACTQKKEDAKVRYFCVKSEDQGKYAHVIVETKGVHYDNISPINAEGDWISWCNNTAIYDTDSDPSIENIKIYVDDKSDQDIKDGKCAGQITSTGKYVWLMKIQEHDGLVSRNDQEISIECDFGHGDKLVLAGDTEIKRENLFVESAVKRPMKYLDEKKEKVQLELVDPSTNKPVTEIILGSPVALRITFGLNEGNAATGIRPYHCKASSPDGKHKAEFLGSNGCPVSGFPISSFYKSGPKSLMTKTFPLFGFDGTEEVEYHCAYSLCFGFENCQNDCGENVEEAARSRRSTHEEPMFIRSTIKILKP